MPKTRTHGDGMIAKKKRADGRWAAAITLRTGVRKYFYGKTQKEALEKLNRAKRDLAAGLPVASDRLTVGEYLPLWLEGATPSLRPRSAERYESLIRRHLVPYLGRIKLQGLQPPQIRACYAELGKKLAPATVVSVHRVLHRALEQAADDGILARNVADRVDAPRIPRKEHHALTVEQATQLLDAAKGHRYEAVFVLAIHTGMRLGELGGLRWSDVDVERGRAHVSMAMGRVPHEMRYELAELKTKRSRRTVVLSPPAVVALRAHRLRQSEERLRRGSAWHDENLVFCGSDGQTIWWGDFGRSQLHPLLRRAGLPRVRFHDLRHTTATLLLRQRMHAKEVADMLGHASVVQTLDTYSHVIEAMHEEAAQVLGRLLPGS